MTETLGLPRKSVIAPLAEAFEREGGRLLIVGGWVRDQLRGVASKDFDLEIFGLEIDEIDRILSEFGSIGRVGRQFPVWRLRGQDLDLAYPREGAMCFVSAHRSAVVSARGEKDDDLSLDAAYRIAARHRDLTLNAIAWDPLRDRLLDPYGGRQDLEARVLRAVDPTTFGDDPLRALRVARLAAWLPADVAPETRALCAALDLHGVAAERISTELQRILLEPEQPSRAFEFLSETGLLRFFPPIAALVDVPQDARWHPEGDVFVHTCMALDAGRRQVDSLGAREAAILQWSVLAHDFGKPTKTTREGDRIRSIGHEAAGVAIASDWLRSMRLPEAIITAVEALVAHHLAPATFVDQGAKRAAYRRLARKLDASGVSLIDLERVARADHLGRTTDDAKAGRFPAGEAFLSAAREERIETSVLADRVTARDLMARGFVPGPALGRALGRAREIQDEQGAANAEAIIEQILAENLSPTASESNSDE